MPASFTPEPSSYRDPAGFLFYRDGILYRQVNRSYQSDYELFQSSGLYHDLSSSGRIVAHEEIEDNLTGAGQWYKTLRPEAIPFISYPYEWCFAMLKDAALLTLDLAAEAMQKGMMLKDASAYNLQWHRGRLMLIDTLSFERYDETKPWIAYRQFCEQLLAPLALMHYRQWPLADLLVAHPDGLPLPLVRRLLPFRSRFNLHTYLHLLLHGKMANKREEEKGGDPMIFSTKKMTDLLRSLRAAVQSFQFDRPSGVWSGYYDEARQRDDYLERKLELVNDWTAGLPVHEAVDLGANEGRFSELLMKAGKYVVSADLDHYSVNRLYLRARANGWTNLHPVVLDLARPSPALGVNLEERASFTERAPKGLVLALALVHHLAIGHNLPFDRIVKQLRALGPWLLIEFVPKSDDKVKLMLKEKKDIYQAYTEDAFLTAFADEYAVRQRAPIGHSGRTLYLMEAHAH